MVKRNTGAKADDARLDYGMTTDVINVPARLSLANRANSLMGSHESRSLRNHSRVLRKCLIPPDVETIGGKIQNWMKLSSARIFSRREVYITRRVHSLIRHLVPIPIP